MIMIESEGITEEVASWRTDVVAEIARELGLEKVMFEAADPEVFGWYVKNYGPEVNLFVDHSQIVQLECLRRGDLGHQEPVGARDHLPPRGGPAMSPSLATRAGTRTGERPLDRDRQRAATTARELERLTRRHHEAHLRLQAGGHANTPARGRR